MKALVTTIGSGTKREKKLVTDWPDAPEPMGNQVKTKTLFTGVTNGTERNDLICGNYARPDSKLPAPRGYQNVGEVIAVGENVQSYNIGDIVFSSSDHLEYSTFAEDWLTVKVPKNISYEEATLFGLTAIGVRTCRNAELMIGDKVLIIGAGTLGLMAGQVACAMAGRVTICDIDKKRLELAESIAFADKVIDSSEGVLSDLAGISTYDIVMDFAGVEGMEDDLIKCVKYKGKILFIAGRFRVNYNFNEAQIKEINIKQNSHFDRFDLLDAARLCKRNKISTKPLIWNVKPLSEAEETYNILRDDPNKLLGTVFDWR